MEQPAGLWRAAVPPLRALIWGAIGFGIGAGLVASGIGLLALSYRLLSKGHFSAESHWGVEASTKYWHFVDVVWVFFYPILYLMSW